MDPTTKNCDTGVKEGCGECAQCKTIQRDKERSEGLLRIIRKFEPPPPQKETRAPPKPVAERCSLCAKRIGPIGYFCRCDGCFCSKHRLPEQHQCNFDYVSQGRKQISKDNPEVVPPKLKRI